MSIKVTFEFDTAADAAAFLQDFDSPQAAAGEPEKRGRGRPRKDPPAAAPATGTAPAAAAQTSAAPAPAAPPAPTSVPAVPMKDVMDAITDLADLGGAHYGQAKGILAKYGATTLGPKPGDPKAVPLDPKYYAAVVEECKAAMPRPTAASLI